MHRAVLRGNVMRAISAMALTILMVSGLSAVTNPSRAEGVKATPETVYLCAGTNNSDMVHSTGYIKNLDGSFSALDDNLNGAGLPLMQHLITGEAGSVFEIVALKSITLGTTTTSCSDPTGLSYYDAWEYLKSETASSPNVSEEYARLAFSIVGSKVLSKPDQTFYFYYGGSWSSPDFTIQLVEPAAPTVEVIAPIVDASKSQPWNLECPSPKPVFTTKSESLSLATSESANISLPGGCAFFDVGLDKDTYWWIEGAGESTFQVRYNTSPRVLDVNGNFEILPGNDYFNIKNLATTPGNVEAKLFLGYVENGVETKLYSFDLSYMAVVSEPDRSSHIEVTCEIQVSRDQTGVDTPYLEVMTVRTSDDGSVWETKYSRGQGGGDRFQLTVSSQQTTVFNFINCTGTKTGYPQFVITDAFLILLDKDYSPVAPADAMTLSKTDSGVTTSITSSSRRFALGLTSTATYTTTWLSPSTVTQLHIGTVYTRDGGSPVQGYSVQMISIIFDGEGGSGGALSAPTGVGATAGVNSAIVSWQASTGSPTSYTVTSTPGNRTCTVAAPATSCTVEGLTAGTSYTFTVTATNGTVTSLGSNPSDSVTPTSGGGTGGGVNPPTQPNPTPTINLPSNGGSTGGVGTASTEPGQVFTLTGSGMNNVNTVNVGSQKAVITLKTATKLGFKIPKNLPAGLHDLSLYGSFGSMTEAKFFSIAKKKIKTRALGFAGNSPALSAAQKSEMRIFLNRLPGKVTLVCNGSTSSPTVTAFDRKLARDRATKSCDYARELNPSLQTEIRITPAAGVGYKYRSVKLTLKNY